MKTVRHHQRGLPLALVCLGLTITAHSQGQLGSNCTADILNRSVQVSNNGTFAIPNVPTGPGKFRVRVRCQNGTQSPIFGDSAFLTLLPSSSTPILGLMLGNYHPAPIAITLTASKSTYSQVGENSFLTVTGTMSDGSTADLSTSWQGTTYISSNPAIASVNADGLVTAVSRGTAIISALNEGAASTIQISVLTPVSTVGDGIADDWKIAHAFSITDATVAAQDPDHDGLTNLQEYQLGTDPNNPDTDGDGVPDGQEVKNGTNPLNPDTDGDGMTDGVEVKLGLNPLVPDVTTSVQGHIVDQTGKPVQGASALTFTYFVANTDATGFFSIPYVPTTLGSVVVLGQKVNNGTLLNGTSQPTSAVANGI